MLYPILLSMRPKQWIKNGFVFTALVFSQNLFDYEKLTTCVGAFLIFCIASGGIYLLNDLLDLEEDRKHPEKAQRPLASGELSPFAAKVGVFVTFVVSMSCSLFINLPFAATVWIYLAIQIGYSAYFKRVVILDVFSISAGFFLRVLAGARAIDVPVSSWLLICTLFISLFLGLGKRRHEIVLLSEEAPNHRKVLEDYSISFLDQMVSVATGGTLISYSLYTLSRETIERFHTENLWYTIPIVLYSVFRYLYLIYRRGKGGSPELAMLEDKPFMLSAGLYVCSAVYIIYF